MKCTVTFDKDSILAEGDEDAILKVLDMWKIYRTDPLTTAPDRPDGYTLPDFMELAKTEQKKSDDAEDITVAIYHRDEANKFKAIAALVGTLRYIAVQAKAAHPGALKVIQMNAEAAIAKITAAGDGVCQECLQNPADKNGICVGCQAYKDHQS